MIRSKRTKKKKIAIRRTWDISPTTKVKPSDKIYDRKKSKKNFRRRVTEDL